jgi:uncharacterized protein (DUF2062 family)
LTNKKIKRKIRKNTLLRFFEYKILHIDDSPHKIAIGLACGLFIAWTPLLGIHLIMVIALTVLVRANKFAGLVSVWVSNIFTIPFVYYPSYLVGRAVCNIFASHGAMSKEQVSELFKKLFAPGNMLNDFYTREYWHQFWILIKTIGPELWIGCFVLGGLIAVVSYVICYKIIKAHRERNPHRRYEKYQQ